MDRHSGQWIKNAKDDLQKLKAGWPSASICGYLYFPFTYIYKYTSVNVLVPTSVLHFRFCVCAFAIMVQLSVKWRPYAKKT